MASLTTSTIRLFDSFTPPKNGMGHYVCRECGTTTARSKLNWLRHVKHDHRPTFDHLLQVQREKKHSSMVLDEALARISDDYDDIETNHTNDGYVRLEENESNQNEQKVTHEEAAAQFAQLVKDFTEKTITLEFYLAAVKEVGEKLQ